MLGKLWKAAAVSLALILSSSVTVGAVTVNFGTAAAVATDNIQNWPAAPATVSETAVLLSQVTSRTPVSVKVTCALGDAFSTATRSVISFVVLAGKRYSFMPLS